MDGVGTYRIDDANSKKSSVSPVRIAKRRDKTRYLRQEAFKVPENIILPHSSKSTARDEFISP